MFGINGVEAIVLIIIALVVIGPERLPQAAETLRNVVKQARRYATGAKEDLKETLGPELGDMDWRKLDPRQYDPRTIVREALLEADEEDSRERRRLEREKRDAERAERLEAQEREREQNAGLMRLSPGERAPFDPEAT